MTFSFQSETQFKGAEIQSAAQNEPEFLGSLGTVFSLEKGLLLFHKSLKEVSKMVQGPDQHGAECSLSGLTFLGLLFRTVMDYP